MMSVNSSKINKKKPSAPSIGKDREAVVVWARSILEDRLVKAANTLDEMEYLYDVIKMHPKIICENEHIALLLRQKVAKMLYMACALLQ